MKVSSSAFYRIASGLMFVFALAHTFGFWQTDPHWGVDSTLVSMRTIHFDVGGFSRTLWDLFLAAGFCVGLFYLFSAVLSWQLGGLSKETLKLMPGIRWTLAICFAGVTVVSWIYLFILPVVFSGAITACLIVAAWLAGR